MTRSLLLTSLFVLLFSDFSIAQNWQPRNPITARAGVYQFVINGVAYVGGGEDDNVAYNDLSAYDPATDTWAPRAPLPAAGRSAAASFVVNGRAYVVSGATYSGAIPTLYLNETWMYDPTTDTWTARAPLPGNGRIGAAAFSIGQTGYVGGGGDFDAGITYTDFFAYDPTANQWAARATIPSNATALSASFALGTAGYVAGGLRFGAGGIPTLTDITWRYEPAPNQWTRRADLPTRRAYCGALATGGFGYVAEGISDFTQPTPARSLLRYNATANTWTSVLPGQGPGTIGRGVPVFFAVANALYLGGGVDFSIDDLLMDFWQLPGIITGTPAAVGAAAAFTLAPNPARNVVRLSGAPQAPAELLDATGRVVRTWPAGQLQADLSGVAPGVYVVRVGGATRRLVVE